jgi:chromosome segregation ATPase
MSNINGGIISVTLKGQDVGLSQLIQKIEREMTKGAVAARNYDSSIAVLDSRTAKVEKTILGYAQAQARAAQAAGDLSGAQRILATAIGQVTPNTQHAQTALAQLQNTINQQHKVNTSAEGSFFKLAGAITKLTVAYGAITSVANVFKEAISAGNELEKQEASFAALSGSAELYAQNMGVAKSQQDRFGGSLKDNLEGLSGFVNLSKRTGIALDDLANTARAMAIIDPAQIVPLYSNI